MDGAAERREALEVADGAREVGPVRAPPVDVERADPGHRTGHAAHQIVAERLGPRGVRERVDPGDQRALGLPGSLRVRDHRKAAAVRERDDGGEQLVVPDRTVLGVEGDLGDPGAQAHQVGDRG